VTFWSDVDDVGVNRPRRQLEQQQQLRAAARRRDTQVSQVIQVSQDAQVSQDRQVTAQVSRVVVSRERRGATRLTAVDSPSLDDT